MHSTPTSSAGSPSRRSSTSSSPAPLSPPSHPAGAPATRLFEIRDTPSAGRAVFAAQDLAQGELIWRSDDLALGVLLREYRREVCGWCFGYDSGRTLRVRDASVGFVFCAESCREAWKRGNGEVGMQAWRAVEALVKGRSREDDGLVDAVQRRPTSEEMAREWERVAADAALIRSAREAEQGPTTKQHRAALQKARQHPISPDTLSFCVSGLVWRYSAPDSWPALLALAADSTPYHSTDDLSAFTRSYLHLLAILPAPLLPLLTPATLLILSSRDSHNAFGIRSLEDDGAEFFGYGCWPAASYFNHSCGPNVDKGRQGRVWEFRAGRDVKAGEELNITYLSGEERKMSRDERRELLKRNWGFECACVRCATAG